MFLSMIPFEPPRARIRPVIALELFRMLSTHTPWGKLDADDDVSNNNNTINFREKSGMSKMPMAEAFNLVDVVNETNS